MGLDATRPIIFSYESVAGYVTDMLKWRRKADPEFSVRSEVDGLPGCSPTLVTQIAKGSRKLTRDRVEAFGRLLRLTSQEAKYLDQWVAVERRRRAPAVLKSKVVAPALPPLKRPQNHLINHWLNAYVKEACRLAGRRAEPETIHRVLGGIAGVAQVRRSLDYLLREGFLRRNQHGEFVQNELQAETTDEIPDKRVRAFHKRALDIAKRGVDLFPISMRKSDAYVLAVNEKHLPKLRKILTDCMDQIEQFEREHADDDEGLYQVILHLTPVGRGVNAAH